MKALIERKYGFWTINGKRSKDWNFEDIQLMSEFFTIIKGDLANQEKPIRASFFYAPLEEENPKWITAILKFFKIEKLKTLQYTIEIKQKPRYTVVRQLT